MLSAILDQAMKATPGMTQKILSEATGIKQGYISQLISGKKSNPSSDVLFKLAGALKIDLDVLRKAAGIQVSNEKPSPVVIGIAGPSCSGKSFIAEKFRQSRPNEVVVVDLDSYYKEEAVVSKLEFTHDNPNAVDIAQATIDIVQLVSGREVRIPQYCLDTHKLKEETKLLVPKPIILLEGLFAFASEQLRRQINIKLWMEAGETRRYTRRLERDQKPPRNRSISEIISRWNRDVVRSHEKYLHQYREHADLIVVNDYDDQSKTTLIVEMILAYLQHQHWKPGSGPVGKDTKSGVVSAGLGDGVR